MSPDIPRRIGRYALVRPIGAGGTGEVWEAVLEGPAGFRKPVALKLLRPGRGDPEALAREARLGALLQHPNVVATFELGRLLDEHGARYYLVMELVRGVSVRELVGRGGGLPPRAVLEIGVQAAAGLAHLHGSAPDGALVHRDVKPANLLVEHTGLVKLSDLGIAAFADVPGAAQGTPGYVSPEQLDGLHEPRSDLFALGAALCVAAVGRGPLVGALPTPERIERMHRGTLLHEVDERLPGLGEVLRRCLRADPAERWSSAGELCAELARLRVQASAGPTLAELVARERPDLRPPARREAAEPRSNLPAAPDRFFGREGELAQVASMLRGGDRLVTLHGLAGTGKSRTALEAVRRLGSERRETWRVDLSAATTLEGVCAAVAGALGVPLLAGDPADAIGRALRGRPRVLLLLDGAGPSCAAVVARWLEAAPDAQLLCTALVPLHVRGERRVQLGPLEDDAGVALFRDRAPAVVRADDPELRALVRELDGTPLAIEIAAARTRAMTPAELRRRLGERLRVLVSTDRDRPERHRSLEAAIDTSAALLGPAALDALSQLAVFEGGFAPGAAEAVIELPGGAWVPDVIEELADASLLSVDPATGRCALPGTVRAWASSRAPERRASAEVRHGLFHAQLGGRDALAALGLHGGHERWQAIADALPDLEVALDRAEARLDGPVAAGVALAAAVVLRRRGPAERALALLQRAAALAPVPWRIPVRISLGATLRELGRWEDAAALLGELWDEVRSGPSDSALEGEVLHQLGSTLVQAGRRDEAEDLLVRALRLFRSLGDRRMVALSLTSLGLLHAEHSGAEVARGEYREAIAIAREVGDRVCEGVARGNLALLDRAGGRLAEARAGLEETVAVHRELGHRRSEARSLTLLGAVHGDLGEGEAAREALDRALRGHREVGDRWFEGLACGLLAQEHTVAGDHAAARDRLEEALAIHREVGNRRSEGAALGNLGLALGELGDGEAAQRSLDRALAIAREQGDRLQTGVWLAALARIEARTSPKDGRARLEEAEGLLRAEGSRVDLAGLLCVRAEVEASVGDLGSARTALAEAEELATRMGVGPRSAVGAELARVRDLVADRPRQVLELDAEGARFRLGEATGDLASRHAIRRVLGALATCRRETPGEALDVERLFAAGWPGETAVPDAARERVYHAIGTLRRLGLAPVLERVEGGWRLDPAVRIASS